MFFIRWHSLHGVCFTYKNNYHGKNAETGNDG